jgi:hypothetical protein
LFSPSRAPSGNDFDALRFKAFANRTIQRRALERENSRSGFRTQCGACVVVGLGPGGATAAGDCASADHCSSSNAFIVV